jgi:hypothetical protein
MLRVYLHLTLPLSSSVQADWQQHLRRSRRHVQEPVWREGEADQSVAGGGKEAERLGVLSVTGFV